MSSLCLVSMVRVCDEGLRVLAEQCAATSARLANRTPATAGPPAQATSVAVSGAHAVLGAVAAVLAARVETTGTTLSTAGIRYTTQDENSAQRLAVLGESVHV